MFSIRRVAPTVPALAPAKALRHGRVRAYEAALVESATDGGERGGDERATARHDRGHGVAAGGGGCGGGHNSNNRRIGGSTSACPHRGRSGGRSKDPQR
jgi:hypothetical protein